MEDSVISGVMELNNEAVDFLQQGRYRDASASLRIAHERLKVLLELQNAMTHAPLAPKCSSEGHSHIPLDTVPVAEELMTSKAYQQSSTALENVFTFFNRGFLFRCKDGQIDFSSPKVQSQIQATVLFNMAISHHCEAIEKGNSKHLATALHLYELSYSVLRNAWEGDSLEAVLLILMSVFCNMGFIASNVFDLERTRYCMEWLKSAISWKGSASLEGDVYFFFFKNLSFVPMREPVLAPAA